MVRDKQKRVMGCYETTRKYPAWRAGDLRAAKKPFTGGFQRWHKLIPSMEIVIQSHSASFVIEVFHAGFVHFWRVRAL